MNESVAGQPIRFVPLPAQETLHVAWPTPNRFLRATPDLFFAKTRANADYGKPGWTRNCGRRFHRGCDISPVQKSATGKTAIVFFTDCESDTEYKSEEPTFTPLDDVFSVFDGIVDEAVVDEKESDFGLHVVLMHHWPDSRRPFYTLYGHLAEVEVEVGRPIKKGGRIGMMGKTSRVADARNWLSIVPHLHFEVWNENKKAYNPEIFLHQFAPRQEGNTGK
jgi:hypothetical protein